MLLPRFSIRTTFFITSGFAVLFLVIGIANRHGQWQWAWGVAIAALTLVAVAFVHAVFYGLVNVLARTVGPPKKSGDELPDKEVAP